MKIAKDRKGLGICRDDRVMVQVNPDAVKVLAKVASVTVYNPALEGCVLVEFDNDTTQWVEGKHLEVV